MELIDAPIFICNSFELKPSSIIKYIRDPQTTKKIAITNLRFQDLPRFIEIENMRRHLPQPVIIITPVHMYEALCLEDQVTLKIIENFEVLLNPILKSTEIAIENGDFDPETYREKYEGYIADQAVTLLNRITL